MVLQNVGVSYHLPHLYMMS